MITEAARSSSRESAQSVNFFLGYIICSYRAVRALVALFNIVFKLDSGLFLAAAAAEGTQQSNKPQYDMLHPLFCHQVGRAPGTVGRACALPGPTLATPLPISPPILSVILKVRMLALCTARADIGTATLNIEAFIISTSILFSESMRLCDLEV